MDKVLMFINVMLKYKTSRAFHGIFFLSKDKLWVIYYKCSLNSVRQEKSKAQQIISMALHNFNLGKTI